MRGVILCGRFQRTKNFNAAEPDGIVAHLDREHPPASSYDTGLRLLL